MKALTRTLALLGCAAALGAALAACDQELGNNDERAEIIGEITYPAGEKIANRTMPAISVSAEEGFTVEFKMTGEDIPEDDNGLPNEWATSVLTYKNCNVGIATLDPYNNTIAGSNLIHVHAYPSIAGANVNFSAGSGKAIDGSKHDIKIEFTNDTITYYLDGEDWVKYSANTVFDNADKKDVKGKLGEFIGYFVDGLNAGEVVFNKAKMGITDLKIKKGVPKKMNAEKVYIGLGTENPLNVLKVEVDGKDQDVSNDNFIPAGWTAINDYMTVELKKGQNVSFTFRQPKQGEFNWNTWSLAIYENEDYTTGRGQQLRGDTFLNKPKSVGFTGGGIWSQAYGEYGSGANFKYESGYDAVNTGKDLPTDKDVVVTVSFDGSDITIKQTIDDKLAMTGRSQDFGI